MAGTISVQFGLGVAAAAAAADVVAAAALLVAHAAALDADADAEVVWAAALAEALAEWLCPYRDDDLAAAVLGPAAGAEPDAVADALELADADGIAADQAAADVPPTAQAGGGAW